MFLAIKVCPLWTKIVLVKIIIICSITAAVLFDFTPIRVSAAIQGIERIMLFRPLEQDPAGSIWHTQDYMAINQHFESLDTTFPKDLIKAIAWCESEWKHYDQYGMTRVGVNYKTARPEKWRVKSKRPGSSWVTYDIGLMQINEEMHTLNRNRWDLVRIQNDPEYNLQAGIVVLENKLAYVRYLKTKNHWSQMVRKYHLQGYSDQEIALKAYNGFQSSWNYLERINATLAAKPWEQAVLQQMDASGGLHGQSRILFQEANFSQAVEYNQLFPTAAQWNKIENGLETNDQNPVLHKDINSPDNSLTLNLFSN